MNRTKVTKTTKVIAQRIISIVAPLIFITAFIGYALIHYQRHQQFLTYGWDLAVFDQPIYLFSQGKTPFSSLHNTHTLGDHWHPLLLLAGGALYKIWADPRMLLGLESAVAVASAAVIYGLAKKVLRQPILALSLAVMYLFAVGFQAMVLDDFHDDVLVTLPLALLFLFLQQKNWLGYWVSVVWVLLTKEEFGLLVAAIGLFLILRYRYFKQGLTTMAMGIISFFLLLNVIMPKFTAGTYWQYSYRHYSDTNRPGVVLSRFFKKPQLLITTLIDHPAKRQTLLTSLISFAGLPVLAPVYLLPAFESLLIRFIDPTAPLRFGFNNHYNGPLITLLAVASIYGARRALKFISPLPLTGIILVMTLWQNWLFHGPINSIFKPQFYRLAHWQKDAHELISQVPRTGSLATQNFLLPHLSQRESYALLPEIKDADYIAVVLNYSGPDFYGPPPEQLKTQVENLMSAGQYRLLWQRNQSLLLQKVR